MKLSLPFIAGIILGVCIPLPYMGLYPASAAAGLSCFISAIFCLRSGRQACACIGMLLSAGLLCSLNARLGSGLPELELPFAEKALEHLCRRIDAIPFRDTRLNGLAKALLTGQRGDLDKGIEDAFRAAGGAHILALSGLHLTLIYGIFNKLLFWMGHSPLMRTIKAAVLVLSTGFYSIMTGAGPSVTRAFLFVVINETAMLCPERKRPTAAVFCGAMAIQLAFNPLIVKSLSFQLSYLSISGIFLIFPILRDWFPAGGRSFMRKIWQSAAISISCQLTTAPLIWLRFKSFPVYFLVCNLLAVPLSSAFILSLIPCLCSGSVFGTWAMTKDLTEIIGQTLVEIMEAIASLT